MEENTERQKSNMKLLSTFPFLHFLDPDGKRVNPELMRFSKTMADNVPSGWAMALLDELLTRTKEAIAAEGISESEYNYRMLAPNSGALRISGNIFNESLQKIFDEIEYRSARICAICGGAATLFERGVKLPVCENCKSNFVRGSYRKLVFEEWVKIEDGKQYNYNGKDWVLFDANNEEKQTEE